MTQEKYLFTAGLGYSFDKSGDVNMDLKQAAYDYGFMPSMIASHVFVDTYILKKIAEASNFAIKKVFHSYGAENFAEDLIRQSPSLVKRSICLLGWQPALIVFFLSLAAFFLELKFFNSLYENSKQPFKKLYPITGLHVWVLGPSLYKYDHNDL